MRINSVDCSTKFGQLQVKQASSIWGYKDSALKSLEDRLANTKHVDVIIDSHGLAIKRKMTDILQRIQSFSLYMLEDAVGINFVGDKKETLKFKYNSLEDAEFVFNSFCKDSRTNRLDEYANVALFLDKNLDLQA